MKKNIFKGDNLFQKFILAILVLVFCSVAMLLIAADKYVQTDKKPTKISDKCWKKAWISSEALMGKNTMPVCKAFEEVLKTTCEPPEKLECNWTLPAGEKRFQKLQWRQLTFEDYKDFIEDKELGKDNRKKEWRKEYWNHLNKDFTNAFKERKIDVKMAVVDIDHDGKFENVVRYNWLPDCLSSAQYGVSYPNSKQLDWKYDRLLGAVNALNEGSDIILYENKAYMFKWEKIPGRVMIYKGYNLLPNSDSRGAINICQYQYLKGGKKK